MERHFLVNRHKGLSCGSFTLIELLIVVAIITVLSTLAVTNTPSIKT